MSYDASGAFRWRLLLLGLFLAAGLFASLCAKPAAADVPDGFQDELVADVGGPTALAFTPDERLLITTQPGELRVHKNGALLQDPALDLSAKICSNSERGLLGVAVDPEFEDNGHVYLYYTTDESGSCKNRVSRFDMEGDVVDPESETVLIDNIHSTAGNHNGGDLHFGKDGNLYVSVGDGGSDYAGNSGSGGANDAARDPNVLLGKILRIESDGDIPADNPYQGANTARCNVTGSTTPNKKCRETFASGLRNPFRMAFDPNASDTRFFINDVGQNAWEEVDEGEAGADYGWNLCEGNHDNPDRGGSVDCDSQSYTAPIHEYSHNTGCSSITGGAFVPDDSWPAEYDGSYLYSDYVCGKIFKLTPNGSGGYDRTNFATNLGSSSAVATTFGPHENGQALYYTTYENGGQVRRIDHVGDNRAPIASLTATPTFGPTPLAVTFDGSESRDPDGDMLAYLWDFGDGTPTEETDIPTTSHTYVEDGTYTATLRARDNSGATSAPVTVRIDVGNTPPEPEIEAPTPDALFSVGQEITLTGSATDAEDDSDGDPDTTPTLSWEVIRHHNDDHTHPYFSGTGNNLPFTAPPPEDLYATGEGNYLEIRLTATDSRGLSRTVTQKLQPRRVDVTFQTDPVGLKLKINGANVNGPETLTSWEGYELNVSARNQKKQRKNFVFDSWSDGGAARHIINTPDSPETYTATYEKRRR